MDLPLLQKSFSDRIPFSRCKAICRLNKRDEKKMYFHFNTSLTAVSLSKATCFLLNDKTKNQPFSMADIKTWNYNKLMADRIIANLDVMSSPQKTEQIYQQIMVLGSINSLAA